MPSVSSTRWRACVVGSPLQSAEDLSSTSSMLVNWPGDEIFRTRTGFASSTPNRHPDRNQVVRSSARRSIHPLSYPAASGLPTCERRRRRLFRIVLPHAAGDIDQNPDIRLSGVCDRFSAQQHQGAAAGPPTMRNPCISDNPSPQRKCSCQGNGSDRGPLTAAA